MIILFLIKVITGMFYGWIGVYYGNYARMIDTWAYHYQSIPEYHLLGTDPYEYLTNLFHNPYPGGVLNFFGSTDSYWNDLKSNVFIKLISIFDIFSFGNYYINVIFFSFLSFWGPIAFYRVMIDVFPDRKISVLLATFFVPSFLYWSSGLHKEGLIFIGISLVIYHVYFANKTGKWRWSNRFGILTALIIFLLLRNFILVVIFPALSSWLIANKFPRHRVACFVGLYAIFCLLFFTLRYINPGLDFPQAVVDKQQAFKEVVGATTIPIKDLRPDFLSFLTNTPQAITLSAFRPYPSDIRHLLSMAAALEIVGFMIILLLFVTMRRKTIQPVSSIMLFCTFFSISLLLAIGFSVNNLGAIVRYRSVVLPLIMVVVLTKIDWARLQNLLIKNIRKNSNTNILLENSN